MKVWYDKAPKGAKEALKVWYDKAPNGAKEALIFYASTTT